MGVALEVLQTLNQQYSLPLGTTAVSKSEICIFSSFGAAEQN